MINRIWYCIVFVGCCLSVVSAQIEVDQQVSQFFTDTHKPYVELYTGVINASVNELEGQGIKSVQVQLLVSKGGQVLHADKYIISQASAVVEDFFHLQRISLDTGLYRFETQLVDLADSTNVGSNILFYEIVPPSSAPAINISSMQLLANVTKDEMQSARSRNGLLMEPLKFKFLNRNYPTLYAYLETYGTDQLWEDTYFIRYDLVRDLGSRQDTVLSRVKKRKPVGVDPILIQERNDSAWASGDYTLTLSVIDKSQRSYATASSTFVLSNPKGASSQDEFVKGLTDEKLNYSLKALTPKIDTRDMDILNNLINNGTRKARESFLSGYWRAFSPHDPAFGYNQYMKVVDALDGMFYEGFGHGFESDRGYIYLKYGRPDQQIRVEDESTAPPYEIWYYADFPATKQNNVRFVFYCPVAAAFDLLHSTARGEINNPQWLLKLYRNSPDDQVGNSIDSRGVGDQWNRRAEDIFNNF